MDLELFNFILTGGGGLLAGLLIAVVWQHRDIQRLRARQEKLLDTLLEKQMLSAQQVTKIKNGGNAYEIINADD